MKKEDRVASTAELKARLSHYLRMVRRGDRVVVTHHGRPIAALEPVGPEGPDERASALVRAGLARPRGTPLPAGFWDDEGPEDPDGRALAGLLEERASGR